MSVRPSTCVTTTGRRRRAHNESVNTISQHPNAQLGHGAIISMSMIIKFTLIRGGNKSHTCVFWEETPAPRVIRLLVYVERIS